MNKYFKCVCECASDFYLLYVASCTAHTNSSLPLPLFVFTYQDKDKISSKS